MYSGEGGACVNGEKCVWQRKARFAWKKENALRCVEKKISVRLHGTITLVCECYNGRLIRAVTVVQLVL